MILLSRRSWYRISPRTVRHRCLQTVDGHDPDKDPITYNLALQIIEQEVEHEEDLQALLEDFELMISAIKG